MENKQACEKNRLKFFPIMMYAIVMGMSGLTIMYQKAGQWLAFPHIIGTTLMYITTVIFFIVSLIYIIKYCKYSMAIKKEFVHPIRINFFAAISISMLMLAIIFKEHYPTISASFWYPGTILHFYLTMHTIAFWINHNQELENVLVPVAGVGFASHGVLMYFFSVGIFFWVILFAVLLNRIIFHHQLAVKFMPTMFILIAPPAVGFIAYFKMYGVIDMFAMFMFNLALFFTLLVAFMYKNFVKIKFFISWWAFVFPLAAMAISAMLMYKKTNDFMLLMLSYAMVGVTTLVIVVVLYQTVIHIRKEEICIQE